MTAIWSQNSLLRNWFQGIPIKIGDNQTRIISLNIEFAEIFQSVLGCQKINMILNIWNINGNFKK